MTEINNKDFGGGGGGGGGVDIDLPSGRGGFWKNLKNLGGKGLSLGRAGLAGLSSLATTPIASMGVGGAIATTAAGVAGGEIIGGMAGQAIGSNETVSEALYGSKTAGKEAYEKYGTGMIGFTRAASDYVFGAGAEARRGQKETEARNAEMQKELDEKTAVVKKHYEAKGYKTLQEFGADVKAGKTEPVKWNKETKKLDILPLIKPQSDSLGEATDKGTEAEPPTITIAKPNPNKTPSIVPEPVKEAVAQQTEQTPSKDIAPASTPAITPEPVKEAVAQQTEQTPSKDIAPASTPAITPEPVKEAVTAAVIPKPAENTVGVKENKLSLDEKIQKGETALKELQSKQEEIEKENQDLLKKLKLAKVGENNVNYSSEQRDKFTKNKEKIESQLKEVQEKNLSLIRETNKITKKIEEGKGWQTLKKEFEREGIYTPDVERDIEAYEPLTSDISGKVPEPSSSVAPVSDIASTDIIKPAKEKPDAKAIEDSFLKQNQTDSKETNGILQNIANNTGSTNGTLINLIDGFNNLAKALKESGAIAKAPVVVNTPPPPIENIPSKPKSAEIANRGNSDIMQFRAFVENSRFQAA